MSSSVVRLIHKRSPEGRDLWWDNGAQEWTLSIKRATKFGSGWASQHDVLFNRLRYEDVSVEFLGLEVIGNRITDPHVI